MINLNYEQAKRFIYVVYSIESGTGGHKQFNSKKDVSNYILKGIHNKKEKDFGFLHKNFSNTINSIKSAISGEKHAEQFYYTNALINYIETKYIKTNHEIISSNDLNYNNSNEIFNEPK